MLVGLSILHLPCWLLERMRKKKSDVSRSVLTPFSVEGGIAIFSATNTRFENGFCDEKVWITGEVTTAFHFKLAALSAGKTETGLKKVGPYGTSFQLRNLNSSGLFNNQLIKQYKGKQQFSSSTDQFNQKSP